MPGTQQPRVLLRGQDVPGAGVQSGVPQLPGGVQQSWSRAQELLGLFFLSPCFGSVADLGSALSTRSLIPVCSAHSICN